MHNVDINTIRGSIADVFQRNSVDDPVYLHKSLRPCLIYHKHDLSIEKRADSCISIFYAQKHTYVYKCTCVVPKPPKAKSVCVVPSVNAFTTNHCNAPYCPLSDYMATIAAACVRHARINSFFPAFSQDDIYP